MKKKIVIIFAVLFLLLTLSSCDKRHNKALFTDRIIEQNSTSIHCTYTSFKGTTEHTLKAKTDCAMKCDFASEGGELHVIVGIDNGEVFYEGNISDDKNFTLNIPKGEYKIILSASHHEGSFSFELKYD